MVATYVEPKALPVSFEFRLRFAHRIVEEMRSTQREIWNRDHLGTLLLEVLEEDFGFDWSQPNAVATFNEYLALAYVAAGHVLSVSLRAF